MKLKMYILIKESIDSGIAITSAAHASLACYLKFHNHPDIINWLNPGPFYKVICKVSNEEFEKSKKIENYVILTESNLNNIEVSIAFKPRLDYPKMFKHFQLWK